MVAKGNKKCLNLNNLLGGANTESLLRVVNSNANKPIGMLLPDFLLFTLCKIHEAYKSRASIWIPRYQVEGINQIHTRYTLVLDNHKMIVYREESLNWCSKML